MFTEETFSFFMAIRFNNNREFFQANHDWYLRAVREPALELAEALASEVQKIDPALETRPGKVLSRVNRDIRFSNDKSPYRDYFFLAFRRPGEERKSAMGLYFDMGCEGASYGAGFYGDNVPLMNALRTRIRLDPESVSLDAPGFNPHVNAAKRMKIPDGIPEKFREWYPARGFYVEREITDFALLKSRGLAEEIIAGYRDLEPMYKFITSLTPEENK